jgi:hypothetical protein
MWTKAIVSVLQMSLETTEEGNQGKDLGVHQRQSKFAAGV